MSSAVANTARGAAASRAGRGAASRMPATPVTGGAGGPAGSAPASRPTTSRSGSGRVFPAVRPPQVVDSGAGFLLGLLLWAWVGLPFLRGGQAEVRDVLRAKFFNKAADGSWLP